jgi:predicted NAD/FAD-binding protein
MPFEVAGTAPLRIAVVGGGVSGLGAALCLAPSHRVTLFEAEARLGGHARTVMAGRHRSVAVDTGFIVFNRATYPLFGRLLDDLGVPLAPSDMSFAASLDGGRFEYGLRDLASMLAQPRNLVRPAFARMVRDILRFNARAHATAHGAEMTIGDLVEALRLGPWFRDRYLLPLAAAIWSAPPGEMLAFPASTLVRFFENHALLQVRGQHRWLTVRGGARVYVDRLAARLVRLGVDVRCGVPVAGVRRDGTRVELRASGAEWEAFDHVVLATHADASLRLLSDATGVERVALGAIRFRANTAVLHADPSTMPVRRRVWSSWNHVADCEGHRSLTYWMNNLQPIPAADPLFVTLNPRRAIRENLIADETTFRHPVFDRAAFAAQQAVRAINGSHRTWFCGAWLRNGFHEDGLASGIETAGRVGASVAPAIAAE